MRRAALSLALAALAVLPAGAGAAGHDMASMAGMHHAAPAAEAPSASSSVPARAGKTAEAATGFVVGTATSPLVMRGPTGPLWSKTRPSAPGGTRHGSFGSLYVGERLAAARSAATRGGSLTTAQATKRLTKRCQRLLKKKTRRLSKADRKRRTACLKQRRKIIADSRKQAPDAGTGATGTTGTTTQPTTSSPTATTPLATTPPPTTPAPTTPSATTPGGPVYAAVGVTAVDGDVPFELTRGSAAANIINFELVNTDKQNHNLFVQQKGKPDTAKAIVTSLPPADAGQQPTHASKDLALAPGQYELVCEVPGHGPMKVPFTVTAP